MSSDVRPHVLTALIYDMALVSRIQSEVASIASTGSWMSHRSVSVITYYILCRLVHKSGITLGEELTELLPRGRLTFARRLRWFLSSVSLPLISESILPRLAQVSPAISQVSRFLIALNDALFFLNSRTRAASLTESLIRPAACDPVPVNPALELVYSKKVFALCGTVILAKAIREVVEFASRPLTRITVKSELSEPIIDDSIDCGNCSICMFPIAVPTATVCGHVFCWECIVEWIGNDGNPCPTCRTDCMPQELLPLVNYCRLSPDVKRPIWSRPIVRNLS